MIHRYWRIRKDAGLGKWCAEYSSDLEHWFRGPQNRSHADIVRQVRQFVLNMAGHEWAPNEAPKPSERPYKLTKKQREELTGRSALKGWNLPEPARLRRGSYDFVWTQNGEIFLYRIEETVQDDTAHE